MNVKFFYDQLHMHFHRIKFVRIIEKLPLMILKIILNQFLSILSVTTHQVKEKNEEDLLSLIKISII
jgi:hypothetical protein